MAPRPPAVGAGSGKSGRSAHCVEHDGIKCLQNFGRRNGRSSRDGIVAVVVAQSQGVSLAFISLIGFVFGTSRVGVFALSIRDDVRGFLLHDGNAKKIVMVSLAVCAIGGALPLIGDPTGAVGFLAFGIVAFAGSFIFTASQANFISGAESHKRGAGAGIFESSIGIGVAIGPTIAGLVSGGSLSLPFILAPVGFLISIAGLLRSVPSRA